MKNKVIYILLIFACAFSIASCKNQVDYLSSEDPTYSSYMEPQTITFDNVYTDCTIYEEFAYLSSQSGIYKISLHTSEFIPELVCDAEAFVIYANTSGIYTVNSENITLYDYNGEVIKTYSVSVDNSSNIIKNITADTKYCIYTAANENILYMVYIF